MNDIRLQRDRQARMNFAADNASPDSRDCSMSLLVQTTTVDTYPTAPNAFYAANPVQVGGDETEGGSASYYVDTSSTVYVYNEGSTIPSSGTRLIAHMAGGRYIVRYDG